MKRCYTRQMMLFSKLNITGIVYTIFSPEDGIEEDVKNVAWLLL